MNVHPQPGDSVVLRRILTVFRFLLSQLCQDQLERSAMTRSMTVPMAREQDRDAQAAPRAMTLLGVSERGGRDEIPEIEGKIPPDLRESLYRNGPGLFERGGLR